MTEPTFPPKSTSEPVTVRKWSPSIVLTNVVAPAPELTVVSAVSVTGLLNVILPPEVITGGSRTVGPVREMAPATVESSAPIVKAPPPFVASVKLPVPDTAMGSEIVIGAAAEVVRTARLAGVAIA